MIEQPARRGVSGSGGTAKAIFRTPSSPASRPARRPATTTSKPHSAAKRKPKKKTWKRLSRGQKAARIILWAAICLVGLLIVGLVAGIAYYQSVEVPDPKTEFTTANTTLYYRDGKSVLGTLAVQNRVPLTYDQMPQSMKDAIVAAEDRTFWTNPGVSVPGMVRAAWNIVRGQDIQSGSTLTQQYVKTMYLTSAQTMNRKVKEMVLSVKMTKQYSKEQILEGYLNTVYFGRGAYGIQAAAKAYFNIDAADLTVPQAAVLAGVLRGPSLYDPSDPTNLPRLLDRYNYVIDAMAEVGTLSQAEANQYHNNLPDFPDIKKSDRYGGPTGFLMNMVENELQQQAGLTPAQIAGGGLTVITTFDKTMQKAAVTAAQSNTKAAAAVRKQDASQLHAAIASVGVGTGEVLALYGGPNFVDNSRNWATTHRMTGSTFKAFAFVAGMRAGASLNTTLNGNTIRVDGQTIHNDSNAQYGQVSLLTATQKSINTAFIDLVQQTPDGPNQVIKAAKDAGATQDDASWQAVPYIPLGTAEVSPLGMANSYATFANNGTLVATHVVLEVRDSTGSIVYQAKPAKTQTIDPSICRDLTYALQSVVDAGTGVAARALGYPAAGKTGTAGYGSGTGAAWFVGFTKQISTAVMYVAGDAGTSNLDPYAPPGRLFYGSGYPAQTWVDYMKVAMKGLPKLPFDPPAYVNNGRPTPTETPTETPTDEPTDTPTGTPTDEPTDTPTDVPTDTPTDVPTQTPTDVPSTPAPTPTTQPPPSPTPTTTPQTSTPT